MSEERDLVVLADVFRALNGGGEGESFIGILAHVWEVDVDDSEQFTTFLQMLGVTLLMVADTWREHGIPDVQTRWADTPSAPPS